MTGTPDGTYKTSSGQTYSVRSTPESERKYKLPTSLTASQGGGSIKYSGGVASSSGGRIIGTYSETSSSNSGNSAILDKINQGLIDQQQRREQSFTPATNVNTRYGAMYADKNTYYATEQQQKAIQKDIPKSNYTGGEGTVSEYQKPNKFIQFVGGAISPPIPFLLSKEDKQGYADLKNIDGTPTAKQLGYVSSLPIFVATLGGSGVFKTSYTVAGKSTSSFRTAFDFAKAGSTKTGTVAKNLYATKTAINSYKIGGFGAGTVAYTGATVGTGFAVYNTATKRGGYSLSDAKEYGISYSERERVYGFAESKSAPTTKSLNVGFNKESAKFLMNPINTGTYAFGKGRELVYGVTSLAGVQSTFTKTAKQEFINRGLSDFQATKLSKQIGRERIFRGTSEVGQVVYASSVGEKLGRAGVVSSIGTLKATSFKNTEAFKTGFKTGFKPLFTAGVFEGGVIGYSTASLRSQKTDRLNIALYSLGGGVSAGVLGSTLIGASFRAQTLKTKTSKLLSNTYEQSLNVADPSEYFGDKTRDYLEFRVAKKTGYRPQQVFIKPKVNTFNIGVTTSQSGVFTPSPIYQRSQQNIINKIKTNSFINTKSNIFSNTQNPTKSNIKSNIFTPTPSPINTKTQSNSFTPTPIFTFTPTNTFTNTPTPVSNPLPVVTPNLRTPFPPIIGWGTGRGRGREGRGVGRRKSSYIPSLTAKFFNIKSRNKDTSRALTGFEVRGIVR